VFEGVASCQPVDRVDTEKAGYHIVTPLAILAHYSCFIYCQVAGLIVDECLFVVSALQRVLL